MVSVAVGVTHQKISFCLGGELLFAVVDCISLTELLIFWLFSIALYHITPSHLQ